MTASSKSNQLTTPLHHTLAVFQGEVGVIPTGDFSQIITPVPSHCTILVSHHTKNQIGVLTHIDEYTSIESTIAKIHELLNEKFSLSFRGAEFRTTIMGGSSRDVSVKQNEKLVILLSERELPFERKKLSGFESSRPQLLIDFLGNIQELKGKKKNLALEFEQQIEYGMFNDFLDRKYPDLPGDKIPFYQIKVASRYALDCPILSTNTKIQAANPVQASALPKYFQSMPIWKKNAYLLASSGHLPIKNRLSHERSEFQTNRFSDFPEEILLVSVVTSLVGIAAIILVVREIRRKFL